MERTEARRGIGTVAPVLACGALACTLLASGTILASTKANADTDTAVTTASITVASTCSLESTLDTAHEATIPNGVYSGGNDYYPNGIGQTTLKAFCNDADGFSIYAVGYSEEKIGKTYLKDNSLVGTAQEDSTNIVTGTAVDGNTSNWAMKMGAVTGTYTPIIVGSTADTEKESTTPDFSNYTSIPDKYTRVAYMNSGTDVGPASAGAKVTTTYAAYISRTQPAGTYEGKVKYTMVHPASEAPLQPQTPTQGCINYFANASNAVGTMGCQSVSSDGASIDLLASNFSREGHGFAGWSDAYDYATNEDAHFYGPQETITVPTGTKANGLSLYAVWVKSQGNLQDTEKVASVCSSLTAAPATGANLSSVSALTDQRDGQTYAIAKLADNNCWMIENLRLENTGADNTNGSLAQGYGASTTYGNFSGLADPESDNFSSTYSANSLYSRDGSNNTINIGTSSYSAYRMPRYNNTNTSARASNPVNNSGAMYSYGNYYTWHAAIADTTYNGTNNKSSDTTSICPSGWRLPHGGQTTVNTTAEFYLLGKAIMNNLEPDQNASNGYGYYGNSVTNTAGKTATAAIRSYPNNFLYSGYFSTSSAGDRGSYGRYWSSTAVDSSHSYFLYLDSTYVHPGTYISSKYSGYSIRCLAGS